MLMKSWRPFSSHKSHLAQVKVTDNILLMVLNNYLQLPALDKYISHSMEHVVSQYFWVHEGPYPPNKVLFQASY